MEKRQIPVDEEMNAIVAIDESFGFIYSRDDLKEYSKGFVNWHKQPAVEVSIVTEGAVNVYVLGREYTVTQGEGFLIMPGYLHSIQPAPEYEASKYDTWIFHPKILYGFRGSYYDKAYYRPVADSNTPVFLFSGRDVWAGEFIHKLAWIAAQCPDDTPALRLNIQHALLDGWVLFATNLSGHEAPCSSPRDTGKILNLINWLHEHYREKFSLAAMAESVSMSRNECCRYFKRMMNVTITEYLLEYRLSKAATLLESSGLNVTEIAEQTGFCDVSYFIKMFRRKTGITPMAYAKGVSAHK